MTDTAALNERPKAETLPYEAREAALLNGHYTPPPADRDGKTWVRTSVLVQADASKLYQMWRDVETAPAWHERIVAVRATGPNTFHWTMSEKTGSEKAGEERVGRGAADDTLEWDFEILADVPEKRIAWRCLSGEPSSAGVVTFEPAPGGRGTMVTVLEQFRVGKLSRLWEAITGRDYKQSVIENLRHFKALAETGEIPRAEPQPHGPRGSIGGIKRSLYGEEIATPPGIAAAGEEQK